MTFQFVFFQHIWFLYTYQLKLTFHLFTHLLIYNNTHFYLFIFNLYFLINFNYYFLFIYFYFHTLNHSLTHITHIHTYFLTMGITREQFVELKKEFKAIDADGNGFLDDAEFTAFLKKSNPAITEAEVAKKISEIDANGDNKIQFDEFIRYMVGGVNDAELSDAFFADFDTDGNGSIDFAEFFAGLKEFGAIDEATAKKIFADADADGNGSIDRDEFRKIKFTF